VFKVHVVQTTISPGQIQTNHHTAKFSFIDLYTRKQIILLRPALLDKLCSNLTINQFFIKPNYFTERFRLKKQMI
jgi:hypothetical protein